jgi:hypothetical protein
MSKVLDVILELKEDLGTDWMPALKRINIWEDVSKLYTKRWSTAMCNGVLSFIILAYDNESGFIEMHKDRWENKYKIAERVGLSKSDERVKKIVENNNATVNDVVSWFLDYQKTWEWDSILACWEYHSEMMRFARTKTQDQTVVDNDEGGDKIMADVDISTLTKGNKEKGLNIQTAIERRKEGDTMHEDLKRRYVNIDTALQKEGKRRMTDATSIMSWEAYIQDIRK